VVEFGPDGVREVAAYTDPARGTAFGGVEVHAAGDGHVVLASVPDSGLWIFRA
jgi:hypothetical protein